MVKMVRCPAGMRRGPHLSRARAAMQAEEMRRQLEAARLEADRANAKAAVAAAAAAAERDKKDREVQTLPHTHL
jgi:hypothetical protein